MPQKSKTKCHKSQKQNATRVKNDFVKSIKIRTFASLK